MVMKLKCGLTSKEKHEKDLKELTIWHDHFCIWPRRVGHKDCRWLETIQRKGEHVKRYTNYSGIQYYNLVWQFEYKAKDGK